MATLHHEDARVEIHKVVVGPVDNNVFVLRCKRTGDAVLLDAANEHERLLELCQRLGVRTVLETHGHWDHIQAVPAVREAGYEVGVTAGRRRDAATPTTTCSRTSRSSRSATCACTRSSRRATPRAPSASASRARRSCSAATRCSRAGRAATKFPGGDFDQIIESIDRKLLTLPAETMVLPGHGDDTTIGTERPHLQEWIDRGW